MANAMYRLVWILWTLAVTEGSWYLQSRQESISFLSSDLSHHIREGEVNLRSQKSEDLKPPTCQTNKGPLYACGDEKPKTIDRRTRKGGLIRISLYRTRYPWTACRAVPCAQGTCWDGGVPNGKYFNCTCIAGWTGKKCDTDINECGSSPCQNGGNCTDLLNMFMCTCLPGFTGVRCENDINECGSSPCQNGGKCTDLVNRFTCTCLPGFTGVRCETDIDECASSPCQNGASCADHVNHFRCKCPPGFYGVLCDTNICRPLPADVVFVLDSSVSMTESQFKKQLEFVSNFTEEIKLGHRDFQVSVITYSFHAHIEFYLDQYHDNVTLKEAIANITYKPGATMTHIGLAKVNEVFGSGHGGDIKRYNDTMADRFVYLMTDGLSNDRKKAVSEANNLKNNLGVSLSTIGIGNQVSHEELYQLSSKNDAIASVYSVRNFDSLYTVLKELVHYTCDECTRSKKSDVVIVLDASSYTTEIQFQISKNALTHIIEGMDFGQNKTMVSLVTFDATVNNIFGWYDYNRTYDIIPVINTAHKSITSSGIDIADVIHYTRVQVLPKGRHDARSFILFVSNGNFSQTNDLKFRNEKESLELDDVEVLAVGPGNEVIYDGLLSLASDPFHVYIAKEHDIFVNLDVMKTYFEYSECDLH